MFESLSSYFWLGAFIGLIISLFGASLMEKAAREKGYTDIHAFALCFWLGIFGYMYIIALPDRYLEKQVEELTDVIKENGISGSMSTGFSADTYRLPEL